ncbi:type II toxin-antitoxin system RelE/ParE family toxin [Salmonella enterica subsp. enterica serovar Sandiego]|nr:type II toxin-antitoxin system RelE/ParE family toxin [Salmonella enterica subsp. enterica serovar Sandiego]
MRFSEKWKQAQELAVKSVKLTPKTSRDLKDIWYYGYHRFGEALAGKYINQISGIFRF